MKKTIICAIKRCYILFFVIDYDYKNKLLILKPISEEDKRYKINILNMAIEQFK